MRARRVLPLLALATAPSVACHLRADLSTLDARTLHPAPAGEDRESASLRATYFPPTTPRARRRSVPLVIVEPLLFRREILYAGPGPEGGLIPYLQGEGFPVWLVGTDSPSPANVRSLGGGIVATVASIAREVGVRRFDLLGLSLGSEGALGALEQLTGPGSTVQIRRVVFLGGGFDFAYPGSFGARAESVRGGPASALCSLDGDVGCERDFRSARGAIPWLAYLPPAAADALAPARDRFPFVARFTHLPVLFVAGKVDGIAPSESVFPLYALWGSDEPDPRAVPKLFFLAGRENGLRADFDQFDLFASPRAEALWEHVVAWLERAD